MNKKPLVPYWVVVVMVFFIGWVMLYAGRTVLNPVMSNIETEFGLTKAQVGGIMSLFFLAYTIFQIPSGILGDKIGRKKVLVVGFVLYAIFIAATNFVNTYSLFIFFWMLAGAAQGTYYGPQYALSSEAIPQKRLALGSAIIGSGMSFGIALGYNLSSTMVTTFETNWRTPFLVIAIPIAITAILMLIFIKEKANPEAEEQKATEKATQSAEPAVQFSFWDLFKNRNLVMAYITIFCSIYGFFVIINWLPYYLEQERGMDKQYAANIASIVPWISIIGTIFFSYISDVLGKRKPVVLFMLPLSLLAIFGIVYSSSTTVLVLTLVLYGFIGKISLNPVLVALVADNAPRGSLSTSFSLYNFFGMGASIGAPYITGFIADKTGSLNAGFYFASIITIIGIIAMLFVKEDKKAKA